MLTRRELLVSASALALAGCAGEADPGSPLGVQGVEPLPLRAVRLTPSIYLDAVEANRRYLLSLNPDRLLHNFRKGAGLAPKADLYGGWEGRGIAGHTLGHYLSACSLAHAQLGDEDLRARAAYIVEELEACQAAHGDGYIGGTTVERDGVEVDGKIVFEEVRGGDIRTSGFDVNGGWVPLYTWHKVHAGLIDAWRLCDLEKALTVMLGMAGYMAGVLESLDDDQMQALLVAEHGGLNESYADTYAITGDERWLRLAERIRHRAVLDPLARRENNLPGLHANTQIPKVIGLARLYEVTGDERHAQTAVFFADTVARDHSYAIGGNSEREHFRQPGVVAGALNDRTCESCNSYNMLKLTRHLFARAADAALFDYYERVHLNHIMAHQHPETGMFAYFMPMSSGARRTWSSPEESFWCCVGSGMESHAKHGESVYWQSRGETLYVALFIPSEVDWTDGGMRLSIERATPLDETVRLRVLAEPAAERTIAIRLPGWCESPEIAVNGATADLAVENGFALLRRDWREGDEIVARFPMRLTIEAALDDPNVATYLHGPAVLAGDLGPAQDPFEKLAPARLGDSLPERLQGAPGHYRLAEAGPEPVVLKPFYSLYDRRTAVYFPRLTQAEWETAQARHKEEREKQAAVDARTIDAIRLGESESERAHGFRHNQSDVVAWGGRNGRQAWWGEGNFIAFRLAVAPGPTVLRALYAGWETDKRIEVTVAGESIAEERRAGPSVEGFVAAEYPIPERLTEGRADIEVRFVTHGTDAPVYECRTLRAEPA